MTDKTEAQPEALRLADRLDCDASDADMGRKPIACTRRKAAAELRRQHAEMQQLKAQLSARQAAPDGQWKCGNEHLPYHPDASHVDPAYRDGWNDCYRSAPHPPDRESLLPDFPVANRRSPTCGCETCRPNTLSDMRFIVCPDCGNKRCPKANHHDNACTNSNAPGQPGSSWEHVRPHGATND